VDEAMLEQDASMTIKFSSTDKDRAIIQLARPANLPEGHCIGIDLGRSYMKIAYWKDSRSIFIDKLSTNLAEVPAAPPSASKSKFLSKNQGNIAAKNRISVTYLDKTYTAALRAQKLGGTKGLGQKKTVDLLPRVLCALTLHKVMEGKVKLILSIPFEGDLDWAAQEQLAAKAIEGGRTWRSDEGLHEVEIEVLVVPESFYAEKFPRLSDSDYPDWEAIPHYVFDMGYQTFIKAAFGFDEINGSAYFDADLSECHDGYGLSRFYGYVANQCGWDDPEDAFFINAVNNNDATFVSPKGEFELTAAIATAADQYLKEIVALAKPAPGFQHFQIVGGGAYRFGPSFCEHFPWAECFVTDLSELVNIIGQALSLPDEFNN
jgi:hypothetical protein